MSYSRGRPARGLAHLRLRPYPLNVLFGLILEVIGQGPWKCKTLGVDPQIGLICTTNFCSDALMHPVLADNSPCGSHKGGGVIPLFDARLDAVVNTENMPTPRRGGGQHPHDL